MSDSSEKIQLMGAEIDIDAVSRLDARAGRAVRSTDARRRREGFPSVA